jgi:hypothetical protein
MKTHKMAGIVTRKLEKQDWYKRAEEPLPTYDEPIEGESPEAQDAVPATSTAPEPVAEVKKDSGEDGIDFTVG